MLIRSTTLFIFLFVISSLYWFNNSVKAHDDYIVVLIPSLASEGNIGQSVASVLKLQIQSNFTQNDLNGTERLGRAGAFWIPGQLENPTHAQAEKLARLSGAQMTLWGNAFNYADGVIAQLNLSMPEKYDDFRETSNEIWKITVNGDTIQLGLPRNRIEFAPIIFRKALVEKYNSPSSLLLCKNKDKNCFSPSWTPFMFRILGWEGEYAKVKYKREEYWLNLPQIKNTQTEVVQFVSGVIKLFRGQWNGVIKDMKEVINNENSDIDMKVDAYLYIAFAKEKLGISGLEEINKAYNLNPYNKRVIEYWLMTLLAKISRNDDMTPEFLLSEYQFAMDKHKYLFDKNDAWIIKYNQIFNQLIKIYNSP